MPRTKSDPRDVAALLRQAAEWALDVGGGYEETASALRALAADAESGRVDVSGFDIDEVQKGPWTESAAWARRIGRPLT